MRASLVAGVVLAAALVSHAGAQVISTPQRISPIPRAQSEPVLAVSGNEVVALWFSRVFWEGSGWSYSADGGQSWTAEAALPGVQPGFFKIEGQHPVVSSDDIGGFAAAVRTESSQGNGISVYRRDQASPTFAWLGPVTVGPGNFDRRVESPSIARTPSGGLVYLAYTEIQPMSDPYFGFFHQQFILLSRSTDGGATFQAPVPLSSQYCADPRVTVGPGGEVYVAWNDYSLGQMLVRTSVDQGNTFGPPVSLGPSLDNTRTEPPTWESDFNGRNPYFILMGGHTVPNAPSIAVDRSPGPRRGTIYACWSARAETTSPVPIPISEVEPNEFFASATQIGIGNEVSGTTVHRGHLGPNDFDRFWFNGTAGTMIRMEGEVTGVSGGATFAPSFRVFVSCGEDTTFLLSQGMVALILPWDGEVPPYVFTLPRTGRYWLTTLVAGLYSTNYRLRILDVTPTPTSASRDHRDIVLVRSTDGGATWSEKVRVNDCPPGDDDSFPEVVVDDLGQVHVAWYDKRDEVDGCGTLTNTYWTVSSDGGQTFRPAQKVSSTPSPWECSGGGPNIGDHLGLAAGGGRVHIAWTEVGCPDSVDIYTARIEDVATGIAVGRFGAAWRDDRVQLGWQVTDARGITAFRVHRSEGGNASAPVGAPIPSRGAGTYTHTDETAIEGSEYAYRLEILHEDGRSTWEGPVSIAVPLTPRSLAWSNAIPNPFDESVTLELAIPARREVRIRVYDVQGHEVARLHEGALEPGTHRITWAGMARSGRTVAPGVYLVRAEGGGETTVTRVLRIR